MKKVATVVAGLVVGAAVSAWAGDAQRKEWTDAQGQRYAYDGAFYSYSSPNGQGVKLWVPPGDEMVRGIILFGNPGGGLGGDTRDKSRQEDIVQFAARHRFAVGGVTGFPGRSTYDTLGKLILQACNEWAKQGAHPELQHAPMIYSGSSNAGVFSFAMMMLSPERTIAITPNVGPFYKGKIDEATRKVPAWLHIGTTDPFFPGGVQDTEALFQEHGDGSLWTWEAEIKGHQNGASDHVDMAFWDSVISLRLPAASDRTAPVKLKEIDPATGWYADLRTWDHAITKVFPAKDGKPTADPGRYGWLPDEGLARVYQAAATRTRNMKLSFVDAKMTAGGARSGTYLSAGGSYIANPGETVTIRIEYADLQRPLKLIEIYDRAKKLGEIDGTQVQEFSFRVEDQALYAIHARAKQEPYERTSNPLQVVVRKPELAAAIEAQRAAVDWLPNHKARAAEVATLERLRPADGVQANAPAVLAAAALSSDQAAGFKADGAISPMWKTLTPVTMDQKSEVSGKAGNTVQVACAYGDAGLYLLFDAGASANARADFHLASVGLPALVASKGSLETYATPALNSLLRNALQFAFDLNPAAELAVSVNHWEPWDMVNDQLTNENAFGGTGLWVDRVKTAEGKYLAEMFIPWTLAGNPGLSGKPAAGTGLVVLMGANLEDVKYRWPYGKDPWVGVSPLKNADTPVYGQIVLMPAR